MTMLERRVESLKKDLEKLELRKEKVSARLAKKAATAEKYGVNVSLVEFRNIVDRTPEQQFAFLDLYGEQMELDDINHRIGTIKKSLENLSSKLEVETAAVAKAKAEAARAKAIEEWKQDGIIVKDMWSNLITGTTPKGKQFSIYGNNGFTERSRHCFSVIIDHKTVFTSGDFTLAYITVKNN